MRKTCVEIGRSGVPIVCRNSAREFIPEDGAEWDTQRFATTKDEVTKGWRRFRVKEERAQKSDCILNL